MSKTKKKPACAPALAEIIDQDALRIRVNGGEHDGETLSLDVVTTKLAMEAVERKHKTTDPGWLVTAEFLTDLGAAMAKHLGWEKCSGSFAYQLWIKVSEAWVDLKKNIDLKQS